MRVLVSLYVAILFLLFVLSKNGRYLAAKVLLRTQPKNETAYSLNHSHYGTEFDTEFLSVCKRLQIKPSWLDAVFIAESSWNCYAQNPTTGAFGFIQFLPSTLEGLGSSRSELLHNAPIYQLKLIEAYYKPAIGRFNSATDLRLYTFYPAALGESDMYIIGDSLTAVRNQIYDLNGNHQITTGEFRRAVQ